MSAFEEVQKAVQQHEQNGHAQRNRENNVSLKKANEEIEDMLQIKNLMSDEISTSFMNDAEDKVIELISAIRAYAQRYQVDKKELLAVLIEELEVNLWKSNL